MTRPAFEPHRRPVPSRAADPRDDAIDVARAIAILGMFVIHAVLVLGTAYPRRGPLAVVLWLCDGRAAATFVTLAGFGVARLARRHPDGTADATLRRRALILWVLGVLNLIVWPGDILRVYGVALLAAPVMLRWSPRTRVLTSVALVALFTLATTVLDWTRHWNLQTLTYIGVWTVEGFVRNLVFDGFRPVVPWLAFFLLGTVLAERDLQDATLQRRLLVGGMLALTSSIALSLGFDRLLVQLFPQLDALTREGLVGTTSLPPMPLFMLSAVGSTALLIGSVLMLVRLLPVALVATLAATGRRALTWYLSHIAILMTLYASGANGTLRSSLAILFGVALFIGAALWSHRHRTTTGVVETLMRRMSAPHSLRHSNASASARHDGDAVT